MNTTIQWRNRLNRTPVPSDQWGTDHWSLLVYIETRTVDHHGLIDWNHLTLSHKNWPGLYAARAWVNQDTSYDAGERYPLRLRGGKTLPGHCEADALMDLMDAGLIEIQMPRPDDSGDYFLKPNGQPLTGEEYPSPKFVTGRAEIQLMPWAKFRLTERGRSVVGELRAHRATGGTWSSFEPAIPV
ncbi:hypothetical protein [Streptomyces sp. 5-10]|uniref:hypothetical protein n=1 Tax=Streptomyces sp. 5-10 TaxID=878925 RepID=UPI00168BE4AE|nr:hypothetical protein [Streptomyces sp. 5-10]MBD3004694.1 hypothetical protein [Streptomyces sp. 5-10]